MKKTLTASILVASLAMAGCHTVNGVGKDVKSAGTAVSKASGEDKKKH